MRRIVKSHPPKELADWCGENRELNHGYRHLLGTVAHRALKSKLLEEQGWLCAYTGRTIDQETSHVEHIKPQCECLEWEDVDYRNVLACFPADGGDTSHGYGAPVKAGWWDKQRFVSPLSVDCERRYRFAWSGHVHPASDAHEDTKSTIAVLRLDAESLRRLRKARIDGFFGFGQRSSQKPLSIAQARTALASIDRLNSDGQLQEFCFVISQLLKRYIESSGSPK